MKSSCASWLRFQQEVSSVALLMISYLASLWSVSVSFLLGVHSPSFRRNENTRYTQNYLQSLAKLPNHWWILYQLKGLIHFYGFKIDSKYGDVTWLYLIYLDFDFIVHTSMSSFAHCCSYLHRFLLDFQVSCHHSKVH